jgi:two-component system response regulator DevR
LELVCEGFTNREIGQQLHIAESTARGHVQAIISKLHVRDRTAAAAEGVRRHLVD